jgi:uncharacterized membrane protein
VNSVLSDEIMTLQEKEQAHMETYIEPQLEVPEDVAMEEPEDRV